MNNALNIIRDEAYAKGLEDGILKAWEIAYEARKDGPEAIINALHALVGKYPNPQVKKTNA